ncbi:MAG: MauE/DoxX family redox-associated membrane protein [Ferruginibacter sp.]
MKKQVTLYVMALFYLLAGMNHFRSPDTYLHIIPNYLGDASVINILAGIAELVLAILLLFKHTQKLAAYGIIFMLLAFIPTHIYMLQTGFCIGTLCAPHWILWIRLLLLQPLLIGWAWWVRK